MDRDQCVKIVALDYFSTYENVFKCLEKTAVQTNETIKNTTNIIYSKIPSRLLKVYKFVIGHDTQDFFRYVKGDGVRMERLLILVALRLCARNNANFSVLGNLHSLFFELARKKIYYDDAWRAIEIGIAERHIMYKKDNIFDEDFSLISDFEETVGFFRDNLRITPDTSRSEFRMTIVIAHLGFLICRDMFSVDILKMYAENKKMLNILSVDDKEAAFQKLIRLSAAAIGIYSKDPETTYQNTIQEYDNTQLYESSNYGFMENYKIYNS